MFKRLAIKSFNYSIRITKLNIKRNFCTSSTKTALVTGGNRGIGLKIAKQLTDNGMNVIMGTRDLAKGAAAIEKHFALDRNDKISLLQLDLSDPYSISDACKHIEQNYSNIDILVNNAGVNLSKSKLNKKEQIIETLNTNYYGTISLTQKLLPSLIDSRIICLTTRDAALKKLSTDNQNRFLKDLDECCLNEIMEDYKQSAIQNIDQSNRDIMTTKDGWINSPYLMSYVGLNIYCKILGNRFRLNQSNANWIGAYCPGHCATDSTEYFGDRSPSESAHGVVALSTMMIDDTINNGSFWAAFYQSNDLDSIELEIMDLINPSHTVSWDSLCNEFVSSPKIQAFE